MGARFTPPDQETLACYLCPGNKRAQGEHNPNYENTYVFINDYSAVKQDQEEYAQEVEKGDPSSTLLRAEAVTGRCYVVTFSPAHNITLADMTAREILPVVYKWTELYATHVSPTSPLAELASSATRPLEFESEIRRPNAQYRYMQIFENKGSAMGCSNPHPHGQVWVTTGLPEEPSLEGTQLQKYFRENEGAHLLEVYAKLESQRKERVVFENDAFLALCPWWATWPFEIMIISKTHKRALVDLSDDEKTSLAEAIAEVTRRYDNLFETHFPYSMGLHQAPLEGTVEEIEASHFHIHFYPPLLRSATVRKFLVGYEMMAEPQRDITPEQAAAKLRNCNGGLYRVRKT
ncbi:MAG: galactose-1-phosphate uridyl transferase [Piccolia ochrophora]|nr:MAG: galactose-1-phosphate uridyl transferase [Piccolia ochrophora]